MKFTLSWLKDYLETDASLEQILERLTSIGLEVEGYENPAENLKGFVVAEVKTAEKHPDADKLRLLKVFDGKEELQIVCGAPNARAGIKVVLARVGTIIPCYGEALKVGKIRGLESFGMLCSEKELCIGENHDGIMELPLDAPVGVDASTVLSSDPVIEIAITPNRAECLGVRGVARDLAASGLGKFKDRDIKAIKASYKSPVDVKIEDKEGCPLFVSRYIKGVKNVESPAWLKDRLSAIGMRPISALVDITNYLNIDMARPLHVFDADKLKGNLCIRSAKDGEALLALDEKTYELKENMIAVCDDAGVQSIAGIMGGAPTGCNNETVNVVLESALFDALRISYAGRKLQAESDSRYRFERHVDPHSTISGAEFATQLILDICGGEASELVIAGEVPDYSVKVALRPERVEKVTGLKVSNDEICRILDNLGFEPKLEDGKIATKSPSWRADIEGEHDLVEEVARMYGYDNIPSRFNRDEFKAIDALTPIQKNVVSVRRNLAMRGMYETVTWGFTHSKFAQYFMPENGDALILSNPISSDLDQMRPSLLPNLLLAAEKNVARSMPDMALFETGTKFNGRNPGEQETVAAGVRTGFAVSKNWAMPARKVDVFDAKADALAAIAAAFGPLEPQITTDAPSWYHPGRSGVFRLGKNVIAHFGEIHPSVLKAFGIKETVVAFEVFLGNIPLPRTKGTARKLLKTSSLQPVFKDLAFVLDANVDALSVIQTAKGADKELIEDVKIFDLYQGSNLPEGKKSIAIQLKIQPYNETLKDKDIEMVMGKVVSAIGKRLSGELRS